MGLVEHYTWFLLSCLTWDLLPFMQLAPIPWVCLHPMDRSDCSMFPSGWRSHCCLGRMMAGFFWVCRFWAFAETTWPIATLGFGEIVRLLAGSGSLAAYFGGPQGIIGIQKPCIGVLEPLVRVDVPRVCNGIELSTVQNDLLSGDCGCIIVCVRRLAAAWSPARAGMDGDP